MGLWVKTPHLGANETVRWQRAANRSQGTRSVGGRLFVTNERLLFEPNRLDSITGGRRWATRLQEVQNVGSQRRDMNPISGGMRNRLRLELVGGSSELFVVNHLDEVIKLIEKELGSIH